MSAVWLPVNVFISHHVAQSKHWFSSRQLRNLIQIATSPACIYKPSNPGTASLRPRRSNHNAQQLAWINLQHRPRQCHSIHRHLLLTFDCAVAQGRFRFERKGVVFLVRRIRTRASQLGTHQPHRLILVSIQRPRVPIMVGDIFILKQLPVRLIVRKVGSWMSTSDSKSDRS